MYKNCFAIQEDILRSRMYAQDKELSDSENKEAPEVVILEEVTDSVNKDSGVVMMEEVTDSGVVMMEKVTDSVNNDSEVVILEEVTDSVNKDSEVVILEEVTDSVNNDSEVVILEEVTDSVNKDSEVVMPEEVEVVYLSSDESDSIHDKRKHVAEHASNLDKSRKNYGSSSSNSSLSGSSFFRKSLSVERPNEKIHKEETRVRYESDSINKKRKRVVEHASNLNKSRKRFRSSSSISSLSDSSFFRKSSSKERPHEKIHKSACTLMKRKQVKKHASNLDKSRKKYRSSSSDSSLSDSSLERKLYRKFLSRERSRRKRRKEATTTRYERSYRDEVASTLFYEPKQEDEKKFALDFYCRDCQLTLNCELTYKSHLAGKRHFKAIKAHHLHEIAKGSIELPANPPFVSLDKPRFEEPAAGRRRMRVSKKAKLQRTVDNETRHPMPGLNHLLEINHEKEIGYYCQLCDAPCDPTTVMSHLIGSRHQMTCLRYIDKEYYKRIKRDETLFSKNEVKRILFKDQGIYGKQRIKVYKEVKDKNRRLNPIDELYFDRPGPSWGANYAMKSEHGETSDSDLVTSHDKYLDTSKADFRCTLCNSHMNNLTMWASHVRGQRHLKNAMKIPGESISKVRSIKASSDVVSELKGLLWNKKRNSVIVGLDYIRETQGPNGIMYNCFLCGAGSTNLDIVDHILLTKHRIKYLEKLQIDGVDNAIALIKQLDIGLSARDGLVKEECAKMQERFGKGTVEVYISIDMYRFSM